MSGVDAIAASEAAIREALEGMGARYRRDADAALAALVSLARAGAERRERGDDCDAVVSDLERQLREWARHIRGVAEAQQLPAGDNYDAELLDAAAAAVARAAELERERDEARKWANTMEHERDWERDVVHSELSLRAERAEEALRRIVNEGNAARGSWAREIAAGALAAASVPLREQGEAEDGGECDALASGEGGAT